MPSRGKILVEMCLQSKETTEKGLSHTNHSSNGTKNVSSDLDSVQIDYMDSQHDFSYSSESYIPSKSGESSDTPECEKDMPDKPEHEEKPPKKRSRWNTAKPSTWKKNINKMKKRSGLPYKTSKGVQPAKKPRNIDCTLCKYKCSINFSDEMRILFCSEYWKIEYDRQKDFILSCVGNVRPKCKRIRSGTGAPRKNSRVYHFLKDGEKIRVCKKIFLRTLSISHGPVDSALAGANDVGIFAANDKRGRKIPGNKTSPEMIAKMKNHIESFPTMESHYCRKSTKRRYLDPNLTITKMYALYVEKCKEEGVPFASQITYRRIFCKDYNLAFFKPRKDQCLICENFNKTQSEDLAEEYNAHICRRNEANAKKDQDKERAESNVNFISVTFDLQSVLQIPSSDVSPMYYSRKLCVYNLTIYEASKPNLAYCFAWSEINGQRGSCEIGTALFKWITSLPPNITQISLFSDTCSGQNRNQFIAALFLYVVQHTQIETLEHNFLEKGLSYMEVDSMHSAIETAKKYIAVYTMHDWLNIFRVARSQRGRNKLSGPYRVHELHYDDFLDLKRLAARVIKNRTTDQHGNRTNWLKIKTMRYEKQRPLCILFKYNYSDVEYNILDVCGRHRSSMNNIPQEVIGKLYSKPLPISELKKQNLMTLCRTKAIPEEFHGWYDSISTDNTKRDTAPEPAFDSDTDSD